MLWKTFFVDYNFLNFSLINKSGESKSTALVAMLGATAAVFGWVFTSRVQIQNATKAHAMQALMNSRTATIYNERVDQAGKILKKIRNNRNLALNDFVSVSKDDYLLLKQKEKAAIHYMLNFLEFIAIGVRHNNMDEELIRGSLKSILRNNYLSFQLVIEHVREKAPSNYTELEKLYKRWLEYECTKCTNWYASESDTNIIRKTQKHSLYAIMTIITLLSWNLIIFLIDNLKAKGIKKANHSLICKKCKDNQ